jgi:long-chain acyl-CoA synthetase
MRCGFFGGDPLKLIKEDLPTLKPTFFPSVPRVYNKIFGILNGKINEMTGFKHNMIKGMVNNKI